MAERITAMLAQPYTIGSAVTATVYDDAVPTGGTASLVTSGQTGTFRTFLAPSGGAGTEASPRSLLKIVETNLGTALWEVRLQSDGRVRIKYKGTTASGRIVWGSSTVRNLLGFDADVGPIAAGSNGTQTGAYQPTHCAFLVARARDSGWVPTPQRFAGAEMPTGEVYGWGDAYRRMRRSFDARFHPVDHATRVARGAAASALFPAASRWAQPASAAGTAPPWSLYELIATAAGKRLGAALGTFQDLVAGTATSYDAVYLGLKTINDTSAVRLTQENFGGLRDWSGIELWHRAAETLA